MSALTVGERLKKLRKEHKLNLKELGEKLSMTESGVSAMERGVSTITSETAIKISKIFNVSLDYLYLGKESEQTISENEQEMLEVLRTDIEITNAVMGIAKLKKKAISYARSYNPQQEQRAVMG
jgi:transcriptional regulator with XRE-family HTH domain